MSIMASYIFLYQCLSSVFRYTAMHSQFGLDVLICSFSGFVRLGDILLDVFFNSPQPFHIAFLTQISTPYPRVRIGAVSVSIACTLFEKPVPAPLP